MQSIGSIDNANDFVNSESLPVQDEPEGEIDS